LIKNPHLHEHFKHINICYYFIQDLAEKGKINIEYIPTDEMIADGMTKPLQYVAFKRFKNQMGLLDADKDRKFCPQKTRSDQDMP
jgi:hypothetical protein